ncbi:DNA polymerase III subunit alpha [bacterium]|nr:DNA polymerase III subunit alpha [bacterium]
MFINLNIHSVYSKMQSTLTLKDIIMLSKSQQSIALTDVNTVRGFINFVQFSQSNKVAPIAGVNLITSIDEVVILVENDIGYENMCRAITNYYVNPICSVVDIIKKNSEGIFVLAYQSSLIERLKNIIPEDRLFIELRPGVEESFARKLSKKHKLEIIATGDVYYETPLDHLSHKTLRAIDLNSTLNSLNGCDYKSKEHWFRKETDMFDLFPNSLDAINNSYYLGKRCKNKWSFINTIFPGLSLKDTFQANKQLKEYAYQGAAIRYEKITNDLINRIESELRLITQKGFAPYFLIVKDIVSQTKSTIGRGSAAASVVSYCLFITQVDPVKYNLSFDRFIHPERIDMPDIDIDFPWDERDNIIDYVFKKYGNERTAMVSNQVFLKPRSTIREVGKVHGLSNEQIKSVTKRIKLFSYNKKIIKKVKNNPVLDIDDNMKNVLRISENLLGVFRHSSVHPGGVVIVPDEICKYVPVLKAPKGIQIVEWEKDQIEDSGLLKIDLLGNRSLAVVRDTIKQINLQSNTNKISYINYHEIQPLEDSKTREIMRTGKTMGVFYIESPSVRQLMAKARVVDFEHIVIFSSIIRPAANRFTNLMLDRIHGQKWSLVHPDLICLNETYGIIVYEEQVSMVVMIMTGLGYAKANKLRKVISRNSDEHKINNWKNTFFKNAFKRGYKPDTVDQIWQMISSFKGFSFCKPHSASYAMLAFTCAYLKTHFTAEFIASVISNQGGYYSSYAYMSEAKRFGVAIHTPDINESKYEWVGEDNQILMGFMSINRLKKNTVKVILENRKSGNFLSLDDFLFRVKIDLSDAMALTNAQCFKKLCHDKSHRQIAYIVAEFHLNGKDNKEPLNRAPLIEVLTKYEIYRLEISSFGYPVSLHPLEPYRSFVSKRIGLAKDIPKKLGQYIYLLGVYVTRKETQTNQNEAMQFLTLEDETDTYECILFPKVFAEFGDIINWETLFIIYGKVEVSFGVYNINIDKMVSLREWVKKTKSVSFA